MGNKQVFLNPGWILTLLKLKPRFWYLEVTFSPGKEHRDQDSI